jgi:lysophospholipase L1-like esterase
MREVLIFALLAITVAMACIVTEMAVRAWIRGRHEYYVLPPGLRIRMTPDPEAFPQLERHTRFDVNRVGERGRELPASGDVYRVLVVGGSTPEGFLLDQDTTWPGALQTLLDTPERRRALSAAHVHVGSIARSGVGSQALELMFRRVLPRYPRLQLIVIMIGATDVLRWLEQGAPDSIAPVQTSDIFRCHPEMVFGWTPSTLATTELIRRLRLRWLRPIQRHDNAGRWIARARAMHAHATEVRTIMPDPAPMLEHFRCHFARVLERAKAHADRVIFVRQPWFDTVSTAEEAAHMWHGAVGQVWRDEVKAFYSIEVCSKLMRILDSHATVMATVQGVEQIDLMPSLERSLKTFYDCFHLTPDGARAIAASVAAAVVSDPAASRPNVDLGQVAARARTRVASRV